MKKSWKIILSLCLVTALLLSLYALSLPAGAEGETLAREPAGTGECGDYEYEYYADGTACITEYSGKDVELVIPAELDGHPVTAIGDKAFNFSNSLTSVTIPDRVISISANPFICCGRLSQITVSPENPALATVDGVLFEKANKRLITYPYSFTAAEYSIPQGIREIGDWAFYGCHFLTNLTIPDSVIDIGDYAFSSCDSLIDIIIPDSVISIGDFAFSSCDSLSDVTIREGITTIGGWAFYRCYSLTAITIPDSLTNISANPFVHCTNLSQITVSPDHPTLVTIDGVLIEKTNKRLVTYPCAFTATEYAIPQGIKEIGGGAFFNCASLTSVTIPDSVTAIGNDTFYGCKAIAAITIPNSVISIGNEAFYRCTSLTSITIPDSVTTMGNDVFKWCKSLTSVTISNSVTAIGKDAFAECPNLTMTVTRDSFAARYCKDNGLNYQYTDSLDWLMK